jgi:hypothetical protein
VLASQGKSVALACKKASVVEQTYHRWHKKMASLALSSPSG